MGMPLASNSIACRRSGSAMILACVVRNKNNPKTTPASQPASQPSEFKLVQIGSQVRGNQQKKKREITHP